MIIGLIVSREGVLKFTERMRGAWGSLVGLVKSAPYTLRTWASGQPQFSLHNYANYVREGYAKNTLVYACINEISQSAAEPRWLAYLGDDPAPDHDLQRILDQPNRYFSSFELWRLSLIYRNIEGNAFLLKGRSPSGRLGSLWPMRPDLVAPVPGEDGELLGYVYGFGSERVGWLPEDVIHLKCPNPVDPLEGLGRGMSPLMVAAREVDVDNSATDFLKKFFDNAAVPFGLLKSKQHLVDGEIKRIRARIKEQYVGVRNWHELLILDADADYQQLALNMDEMAFPDLRALSESRICMAFQVPPILVGAKVGLDRSTFSNYGEARKSFWQETLSPIYREIEDKLNAELVPEFGDRRLRVVCDFSQVQALRESRDALFKRAQEAVSAGWGTVNDARREVGWEVDPGGDVYLRPMMLVEVPAKVGAAKALLPAGHKAIKSSEEHASRFSHLINRTARAWETRFQEQAVELLQGEKGALLERLERRKGVKAAQIDWTALNVDIEQVLRGREGNWREGFIPLFEGLISDQGDVITASFGIDFSLQNPAVQTFIRDYSFQFAEKVSSTAIDKIRGLTLTAQTEGWGILEFIDAVTGTYDEWALGRAEMIARSETIRSSNAGARDSYQAAGVTKIEWFTAEDERVCPFCAAMHGRVIGIDDLFWKQGQEMAIDLPDEQAAADLVLEFTSVGPAAWGWSGLAWRQEKGIVSLSFSYGDVGYPPLHPLCRCTLLPVVD